MIKEKKSSEKRTNNPLMIYAPIAISTAVRDLAEREKRSVSSLLLFIVSDYLEKNNLIEGGENN